MEFALLYYAATFAILGILVFSSLYVLTRLYSALWGVPYVPTDGREVKEILMRAGILPGMRFLELGCGDGRVTVEAVASFGAVGVGIDINPILVAQAQGTARKRGVIADFSVRDIREISYHGYPVIYAFLMPDFMKSVREDIEKTADKGALFISHGFKVEGWEAKLVDTRKTDRFSTYYYRL
jgi:SAM-dependent methyltransferase